MSFPAYREYKESGVPWLGAVPAHWATAAGRRLFRQVREPSRAEDEQLSASQKYGVIPQSRLMQLEDQKVVLALKGLSGFKHVDKDDFVISLRSFQGGIEHSAFSGCVSPAYTVLKPTVEQCPRYFFYALKSGPYIAALQSVTDGIRDGKNISYEQFGQVRLPMPERDEQQAIASFLDRETAKIDALVAEQERLIALLKEKRQAVISHAVTKGLDPDAPMKDSGIEWLGEIPAHWEAIQQRRLLDRIEQGWSPQAHDREPVEDEVSVLRLSAIRSGKFRPDERKALPDIAISDLSGLPSIADGDFLLTRANTPQLVGDCAIANGVANTIFSDLIYRLTFNHRIHKQFALFALLATATRAQIHSDARGTSMTMAKISHGHVKSWWLALPPRSEQVQISEFLEDRETDFALQSAEIEKALQILLERRAALVSAAVTGKIDVRGLVEQHEMEAA